VSQYYCIKSKITEYGGIQNVLKTPDYVQAGTPQSAVVMGGECVQADLDAGNCDTELWEFIEEKAGSDYYFIRNKVKSTDANHPHNVIDITGASKHSGTPLQIFRQKDVADASNQLWSFAWGPGGSSAGYFYITSKLNNTNVIDLKGLSREDGAPVQAFQFNQGDNQLWCTVPPNPNIRIT
jgi:hypothetical protein